MRIAVTGSHGQLGRQLCRDIGTSAVPLSLPEVDITEREKLLSMMCDVKPDAIINCAAYTQVDKAEKEESLCS